MQYMGGKEKIANQIVEFMQPEIDKRGIYVEPFVGGASVISRVKAPLRIGADINEALINMYKALSNGWIPPNVLTEEEYNELKRIKAPNNPLTAFAGFGCSFGGVYFSGYAKPNKKNKNYASMAHNSIRRKMRNLLDVKWIVSNYNALKIQGRSVIYCDPPYANTTRYKGIEKFDSDLFWEWCSQKHYEGHAVYVSEYKAPENFECRFKIKKYLDLRSKNGNEIRVEKIFVHKDADYGKTNVSLLDMLCLETNPD